MANKQYQLKENIKISKSQLSKYERRDINIAMETQTSSLKTSERENIYEEGEIMKYRKISYKIERRKSINERYLKSSEETK